jgi:ligand-binding SRPBCC domain-containing protein
MQLEVPIARVFAFFSDAANLPVITPPEFGFLIVSPMPLSIQSGAIINYKIRLLGIPVRWQTLISKWEPPHLFVDEQLRGPYRSWIHVHRFRESNGRTITEDEVEYSLPLFPMGEMAHPFVRRKIEHIFRFRHAKIEAIFAQK